MKFIFAYLVIIGAFFSFLVPPFQKPDETLHFKKTVAVSYGVFNCPKNNQVLVEKDYVALIQEKTLQSLVARKNQKLNFKHWLNKVNRQKSENKMVLLDIKNACRLPTISYLPFAAGLVFSRIVNLNSYQSFFMGRFLGFLFFLAWFYFLLKSSPKSIKKICLLTLALPMTGHQLTAYSYDGLQIMLSLTGFVSLSQLFASRFKNLRFWLILIICFFIFLVTRPVIKAVYPATINPSGQLQLLTSSPFYIVEVIVKTTYRRLPFYLQSLIGIFGWLEYGLDYFSYFFYCLLILYVVFQTPLEKKLTLAGWQDLVLGIFIFLYYLFLLLVNFLFWTPYKSKVVDGIQGRYFIFVFPFLLFLLINLRKKYLPKLKMRSITFIPWLTILLETIIIALIFRSIFVRFYF